MVKVFGEKIESLNYQIRIGVYAIIFNSTGDKVLIIQNSSGDYFLPGGGIKNNENYLECLEREMLEETGYKVSLGSYIGNAKNYFLSTKNEPLLNDGYFYLAKLLDKRQNPIEDDYFIKWVDFHRVQKLLVHEHHYWAVNQSLKWVD
jgi:8-oxo-dGTP diphosphatase